MSPAVGAGSGKWALVVMALSLINADTFNAYTGAFQVLAFSGMWHRFKSVSVAVRLVPFVCVLAAARDGQTLHIFRGTAEGVILDAPRGQFGFGYDPLFYFPQIGKTFAELSAAEKAQYSHRGAAFRAFLEWYRQT